MIVFALDRRYLNESESSVLWCIFSTLEKCTDFISTYKDDEPELLWFWAVTSEQIDDPNYFNFDTKFFDPITGKNIENLLEFEEKYPEKK
jgi:hypothetical protein